MDIRHQGSGNMRKTLSVKLLSQVILKQGYESLVIDHEAGEIILSRPTSHRAPSYGGVRHKVHVMRSKCHLLPGGHKVDALNE